MTKPKYCAYGFLQQDSKAILQKITEYNSAIIITNDGRGEVETWDKHCVKVFDSKNERDVWMRNQNFQYDLRS